ncbi:MAG: hypothetical protein EOM83_12660 [Clostridia bacterium]|nr:hypothetical protein [Clostridia bacterium]
MKKIKTIAITACGASEGVSRADDLAHEIFLNIEPLNKACSELIRYRPPCRREVKKAGRGARDAGCNRQAFTNGVALSDAVGFSGCFHKRRLQFLTYGIPFCFFEYRTAE